MLLSWQQRGPFKKLKKHHRTDQQTGEQTTRAGSLIYCNLGFQCYILQGIIEIYPDPSNDLGRTDSIIDVSAHGKLIQTGYCSKIRLPGAAVVVASCSPLVLPPEQ